ncbi:septum formation inhibitor Maf [Paenibacillus sp. PR3]|uniref:dTTP/UTP pyrophosphatase n=1 Tax=Paenibacillus terricola TaxID=2763503 RepID=A0ABR8MP29_9BACL|nr:Maf family protein [Paenibacillus terricola]MBD3917756.1 septum formation inhibitor Maf [Paenibacillus terricola]
MAAFGKELQSNKLCQLVLASSSPRRQELVASLDLSLPVRILSTDADESIEPTWSPAEVVEKLAERKAAAAAARLVAEESDKPSLVIGADTIVVLDGEVLGKPIDQQDAIATLMRLQGRSHDVFTGVACIHSQDGTTVVQHRHTQVWMKPLSQARVERYVATGEPMDKAGSYGIQGLGSTIVERIEGCYFNVVGLPLSLLADMLGPFGVDVY